MLKFMREKAGSWFIKVILGLISLVFIFWGAGSFQSNRMIAVATVNGAPISAEDYRETYNRLVEQYRQQFGQNLDENMLRMLNLERQALDSLVDQSLLRQEAKRLDIRVTDQELVESIRQIPAFQVDGNFDRTAYNRVLGMNRLTPETFETMQRDSLLVDKMRSLVVDGVNVSDAEARTWYRWNEAEVNVEYARFSPDDMTEVTVEEAAVREYYEANVDNYKTEPRVKARYVAFQTEAFEAKAEIAEAEIEAYYNANSDEFNEPATVRARHILFSLDENAEPEVVEEKRKAAEAVMTEAREGADFAELARAHSEGPSAERGGDLGTFTRDRMVAPFAEAAFSMEPGEISDPVRTRFGWHIIKVEAVNEAKTESLEEARDRIVETLKAEQAKRLAEEAAENLVAQVYEGDSLGEVAEMQGLTAEETEFFTRAQGPKGMAGAAAFSNAAFSLETDQISEPEAFSDGYYVIQVVENEPAEIAPFEDVAAQVRADLLRERREEKAREAAEAFLARLKAGEEIPGKEATVLEGTGETESADSANEDAADGSEDLDTENSEVSADAAEDAPPETPDLAASDSGGEEAAADDLEAESDPAAIEASFPTFEETGFFGRNSVISGIGRNPAFVETAFQLTPESPIAASPIEAKGDYYVIRFKERKVPEDDGFEEEKADIKTNLAGRKQRQVFDGWLAQVRDNSEVVIKEDVLN
ncbi:MAG: SurA N-terminal domain-containing protein [Desulfococcaceae bacterium]